MSSALEAQLDRDDERSAILSRVQERAGKEIAEQMVAALYEQIRHLRTMANCLRAEFGVNVSPDVKPSAEVNELVNHFFDNAYGEDAVDALPLDYQAAVDNADGDLLAGDDEIAVDAIRKQFRKTIRQLAGTNE